MQTHFCFSVAKNGLHLFRTDWYSVWDEGNRIKEELIRAFPRKDGYTIQQYTRDESMERVELDN